MNKYHNTPSRNLADDLGRIKAQLAELAAIEAALKAELIERGEASVDGDLYRVSISRSMRSRYDTAALREHVPEELLNRCLAWSPVTTVRCSARVGCRDHR